MGSLRGVTLHATVCVSVAGVSAGVGVGAVVAAAGVGAVVAVVAAAGVGAFFVAVVVAGVGQLLGLILYRVGKQICPIDKFEYTTQTVWAIKSIN